MKEINCSACGNRVSRNASACPYCGDTTLDRSMDLTEIIGLVVCMILILGIIFCSAAIVMK